MFKKMIEQIPGSSDRAGRRLRGLTLGKLIQVLRKLDVAMPYRNVFCTVVGRALGRPEYKSFLKFSGYLGFEFMPCIYFHM